MSPREDIDFPHSRAILIGTSTYTEGFAGRDTMPAAANSLRAMRSALSGACEWPQARISVFADQSDSGRLLRKVAPLIHETTDVLLFYYVGHGQLLPGNDLGLALTDTSEDPKQRALTSLQFSHLRQEMDRNCDARVRVVILDCCCSGIATKYTQGAGNLPGQVHLAAALEAEGSYIWTACGHSQDTYFEPGAHGLTYFTRFLTEALWSGRAGSAPGLTPADLNRAVTRRLRTTHIPTAPVLPEPTLMFHGPNDLFVLVRGTTPAAPPTPPPDPAAISTTTELIDTPSPLTRTDPADSDHPATGNTPSPSTPGPMPVTPSVESPRPRAPAKRRLGRRAVLLGGLGILAASGSAVAFRPGPSRYERSLAGHTNGVTSVAFSPDGKTLATGSWDFTALLWDVATGRTTATLTGHNSWVNSVAFSPDGRTLAAASEDGTVWLWDVATGRTTTTLTADPGSVYTSNPDSADSVAFSPDGKTLATSDGMARLWDVATGRNTVAIPGKVLSVAFSPDGKTLAIGGSRSDLTFTVWLWDVATGRTTATLTGHNSPINSVAFSPDSKTLATASGWGSSGSPQDDHTARLWNVATGHSTAILTGHNGSVNSVAFSPNGKTLATGSEDRTARLWNVATGSKIDILTGHTGPVHSVAFSPNGKTLATGSGDWKVRLWKTA